jgi:hypothetical protein
MVFAEYPLAGRQGGERSFFRERICINIKPMPITSSLCNNAVP